MVIGQAMRHDGLHCRGDDDDDGDDDDNVPCML